jgi:hypothetical protein
VYRSVKCSVVWDLVYHKLTQPLLLYNRYFLSSLNPILRDAVSLQQSGRIELTFEPDDLAYPAAETTVRMQPLRLTVGRSPLLRQLLATLAVVDKWVLSLQC